MFFRDGRHAKIEQQKTVLEKARAKYEEEKETLADLIKLRNEMRKEIRYNKFRKFI